MSQFLLHKLISNTAIPPEELKVWQNLALENFGSQISTEEAEIQANRLIRLLSILTQQKEEQLERKVSTKHS
jgi:hypothetical protein